MPVDSANDKRYLQRNNKNAGALKRKRHDKRYLTEIKRSTNRDKC